jgi:group I intron endonuclease
MKSIYKIENKINGKLYIGQTINSLKTRFKKHLSQINCKNQCSALYSAIRKYGKENFEISEIVSGDFSKDELNNLEIFFIQHYNTLSPNGYNLQTGGNTTTLADEVKKSISNTMMGRKITWSEKISETIKQKWQNPEYREKQTNQRYVKRGKYREGIVREKLRVKIDEIEFVKDYKNGMKIKDLESKYKISTPTVYRLLKTNNICKRR